MNQEINTNTGFAKFISSFLLISIVVTITAMFVGKLMFTNGLLKIGLYIICEDILIIMFIKIGLKKYLEFNCWILAVVVLILPYLVTIIILRSPFDFIFAIFEDSRFITTQEYCSYTNVFVILFSTLVINRITVKREIKTFLGFQSLLEFLTKYNSIWEKFYKFIVAIGVIVAVFLKLK